MIRQVYLKNWRSHGEKNGSYGSVIEFEEGLNVIYGVNGSGKSSVAEAIAYALFGEVSSFKRVLRSGKDEGSVKVVFEADGMYEVVRTFSSKGTLYSELFRIENGRKKPVVLQKSIEVTRKIEEILGISKDLFFRAVYGAQNKILELFEKRGLSRAEIFDQILGLEELNEVRERLVRIRNSTMKFLKSVSLGELLRRKKELEELIENLNREILEKEVFVREKDQELRALKRDLEELEREVRSLERDKELFEMLMRKQASLLAQKREIESGISFPQVDKNIIELLERMERDLERAFSLEKEINALRATIEKIEKDLSTLEIPERVGDLEFFLKRKEQLHEKKKALEEKWRSLLREKELILRKLTSLEEQLRRISELKNRLEEIKKEKSSILERIEREAQNIEERLKRVLDLLSYYKGELSISSNIESVLRGTKTCPVCGSSLTEDRVEEILREHQEKIEIYKEKISRLEEERKMLERASTEIKELRGKLVNLEKLEKELSSEVEKEAEISRQLDELKKRLNEVESSIKEAEIKIQNINQELDRLEELIKVETVRREKIRLRERLESDLQKARARLLELRTQFDSLLEIYGVGSVDELRKKIEEAKEKKRSYELKQKLVGIEKMLLEVEGEIRQLRPRVNMITEKQEKLEKMKDHYSELRVDVERTRAAIEEKREKYYLLESELNKLTEEIEKVERLRKVVAKLDKLTVAWNETLKTIRSLRIDAINRALKLVWREVYTTQYGDYTDIEFRVEETRGGYTYSLLLKTKVGLREIWRSVEELSGGERTLALIALRLAVSYLLSGRTGFIIMDEPTHNLDENLTRKLAFFLKEATQNGLFRQIIVITHDPVFSEAADVVYRFEREKTGDDPTVVVREK